MITVESYAILWGCAELNGSFHDEALIISSTAKNIHSNPNEIKPIGLQLLENRSFISETDLKNSDLESPSENYSWAYRSMHCENVKCDYTELKLVVVGVILVILIFGVTIYRISIYCNRNNVIYF